MHYYNLNIITLVNESNANGCRIAFIHVPSCYPAQVVRAEVIDVGVLIYIYIYIYIYIILWTKNIIEPYSSNRLTFQAFTVGLLVEFIN